MNRIKTGDDDGDGGQGFVIAYYDTLLRYKGEITTGYSSDAEMCPSGKR